jgi:hypothetical protein
MARCFAKGVLLSESNDQGVVRFDILIDYISTTFGKALQRRR